MPMIAVMSVAKGRRDFPTLVTMSAARGRKNLQMLAIVSAAWCRGCLTGLERRGVFGVVDAPRDLRVDLLDQQLLAEGVEFVRVRQHVELDLAEELAHHQAQLHVAQHREELGQGAVLDRLVLPHLARQQQRDEEQWPPRARMQGDVRALLEPA